MIIDSGPNQNVGKVLLSSDVFLERVYCQHRVTEGIYYTVPRGGTDNCHMFTQRTPVTVLGHLVVKTTLDTHPRGGVIGCALCSKLYMVRVEGCANNKVYK